MENEANIFGSMNIKGENDADLDPQPWQSDPDSNNYLLLSEVSISGSNDIKNEIDIELEPLSEDDNSQELAIECSTACSPDDDDFDQQHSDPEFNQIFFREAHVEEETRYRSADLDSSKEAEFWPSNSITSGKVNIKKGPPQYRT
ncbi:uncharacterized protein LOC111047171 isoform X3 [Nilaparvata lugens]|uniref:uncharacterized protein LOC111047171 isoform X3 n=1 Tax=Nilaparvata lugens TaxID=108931 RepID=UPI00193D9B4F|nr:uncharacterized protein LOC111047171 isoform X3 [Nilaparvata lugens]